MDDRGQLTTEHRNPRSMNLHCLSVEEAFALINAEDTGITRAIADAGGEICRAIELVIESFRCGGRLIYVGAGTSGRLGVLDATECPPTFLSDPEQIQGVIAGGHDAITRSVEGAEDDPADGAAAMDKREVSGDDVVFGIATGGTTPYVHGAIRRAGQRGAKTVFLACVAGSQVADDADVSIRVDTGPEVLTGSTRMKAGTATKMILNMVTTIAMVRSGKVYENLMVDMNTAGNTKLQDRGTRVIGSLTGLDRAASGTLLGLAGGHVKTALVMHARGVEREEVKRLLDEAGGQVGQVIEPLQPIE